MISAETADRVVDASETVGGLLHRADTALHFFAGAIGDVEQYLGRVGDALDAGDHLVDGGRGLADARGLYLRVLHHVLHVDGHLVHGAGDFVDSGRGLDADLSGLVGGVGDLVGAGGDLGSRVADRADKVAKPGGHIAERYCQECRAWNAAQPEQ